MMYDDLEKKVVVITGAAKGLGKAMAERFGKEKAHVVLNYHTENGDHKEIIKTIEASGGKATAIQGDFQRKRM
ncbi:NAD(P)-dependent dehydrogenase (short-subunit alcohol dehydrogenase family) [Peribacillus sp. V2I11]|nr:NAD(P)-dependent dehydrogenase (short-subunit alcohol dehydrogenase family) [Peribacillus sp. V2I11]